MTTSVAAVEERKLSATAERFCRRFSLAEIQLATEDFSEARLIGKGGFGKVYKGQIDDGQQTVAMKRLAPNSNQGEGEFLTEIETLSKLRHVNLVSLIGYCDENGEMILVYEYMPCGTLGDHIYNLSRTRLTWKQRLNLCIGAGRGLDYLHTGWDNSIIHRDVKSTNILLDENLTAKVSDFGLAKHLSSNDSKSHVSTLVKGSFGYLDPSYFTTGRLTRNSDTYAFGVVLLEVLSGRPAVDPSCGEEEMSLVTWAKEKIRKAKVDQIIASNLRDEISADCLKTFVGVAKRCLHHEPQKRPSMGEAVIELQLASKQQDRKAPTHKTSRFLPFLNRDKPSGSKEKDNEQADVNMLLTATPAIAVPAFPIYKLKDIAVPAIPIHELKDITNNFSSQSLISKGFSGSVYKGALKSGQVAAIKIVNDSGQPDAQFLAQVSVISSLQHENLTQLLGYCVDGGQQLLAYEFAPTGSLYDILHGQQGVNSSKPAPVSSWGQRLKIAVDAAIGLEYVYEKSQVHCNIRSSNILLFDDYQVAKLVDFGRCHPSALPNLRDYHPPEYYGQSAYLSSKGDVYSFGVILFELFTGEKVINHMWPDGGQHLVDWATDRQDNEGHLVPWFSEDRLNLVLDARLKRELKGKAKGEYYPMALAKLQSGTKVQSICEKCTIKCNRSLYHKNQRRSRFEYIDLF